MQKTVISENGFRISLPGHWTRLAGTRDAGIVIQCGDKDEQLTISLFGSKNRMSADQMKSTIETILKARRESEQKLAPTAVLTAPSFSELGKALAARYSGVDSAQQRRFANLILCSTIGAWNFYLEGLDEGEAEFDSRSREIMGAISIENG